MIINKSGVTIRIPVSDMRVMGRATQGVRLIRLDDEDQIASVAQIDEEVAEEIVAEIAGAVDELPTEIDNTENPDQEPTAPDDNSPVSPE